MVVLSDDPRISVSDLPRGTLRVGYLSVGEADRQQGYWAAVRDRPFLIEPDPNWPDNMRVDLRDAGMAAAAARPARFRACSSAGFSRSDARHHRHRPLPGEQGSGALRRPPESLRAWLRELRRRHPGIVLLANGTDALVDAAPLLVDGYVVEGMFATYDFGRRDYRPTTENERTWKMAQIDRAAGDRGDGRCSRSSTRRWVTWRLGRRAATESADHGFRPAVTVKDINSLP